MLVLQDAFAAAARVLDGIRQRHEADLVIASVIDHPTAWAFGYNDRRFVEGQDLTSSLVGNGPIVVPKSGAEPFLASSATPVAEQLDQLDRP